MFAAIFELDSRAADEILDCARNEHLSGFSERRYAGPYVDGGGPPA